jgi:hypothetical protein
MVKKTIKNIKIITTAYLGICVVAYILYFLTIGTWQIVVSLASENTLVLGIAFTILSIFRATIILLLHYLIGRFLCDAQNGLGNLISVTIIVALQIVVMFFSQTRYNFLLMLISMPLYLTYGSVAYFEISKALRCIVFLVALLSPSLVLWIGMLRQRKCRLQNGVC